MFRNGPFLATSAKPSQAKGLTERGELTSLGLFSHSSFDRIVRLYNRHLYL